MSILKENEFYGFIHNYRLILPEDLLSLLEENEEKFRRFAQQLSEAISSDPHMLPIEPREILALMKQGLAVFLTDPRIERLIGFAKLHPWGLERRSKSIRVGQSLCFS